MSKPKITMTANWGWGLKYLKDLLPILPDESQVSTGFDWLGRSKLIIELPEGYEFPRKS